MEAVRLSAEATGTALILSAATSITGFVLLALSLLASLTVLPSLLYMFTPSKEAKEASIRHLAASSSGADE